MTNIFWIDLEMTGLDVNKEVIIEVGAIITDLNLEELHRYHTVVKQPQEYLDNMDEWNTDHHSESGLIKLIPNGREPEDVENDLLNIADKYFPNERPVIAGNSISQDRAFINKYFERFSKRLHYRMLDVTAYKIFLESRYGLRYEKRDAHRADIDIEESIGEFRYYLEHMKIDTSVSMES